MRQSNRPTIFVVALAIVFITAGVLMMTRNAGTHLITGVPSGSDGVGSATETPPGIPDLVDAVVSLDQLPPITAGGYNPVASSLVGSVGAWGRAHADLYAGDLFTNGHL
jgi:hypothetical protein